MLSIYRTFAVLSLLLSAVCQAAEVRVTGPSEPVAPGLPVFLNCEGVVKGDPYSLFMVPANDGQFLVLFDDTSRPVGIYSNQKPGVYSAVLVAYDAESKSIVRSVHAVTIGNPVPPVPPGPTPVPPGPVPPGPTPPVVEGKRSLLIIRESADSTPSVARMITALRNAPHADYLKSKGHTLSVLDDDAVDAEGNPSALVEQWKPHYAGLKLPVLFVIDPNGNKLVGKPHELPEGATADEVVKILKANGG